MQRQKDSVNLMTFIKPHQSGFLLSIILAVISVTSGIVPYFAVARIVNLLIGGETNFSAYLTWGIVALIAYLMKSVFHGLSTRCSHEATFHVLSEIRQAIADKLTRVSMGYLTDTPSGRLKTTMVERVEQMEVPLAHIIPEMTSNLLVPIAIIIYLFVLDWRMALVSLITIPIGMLCYMAQMKEYPKKYGAVVQASKYMSATTVEYINGIEVIKAFNQSAASYGKFTQAVRQSVDLMLDWMKFKYACPGVRAKECTFKGVEGVTLDEFVIHSLSSLQEEHSDYYRQLLENRVASMIRTDQSEKEYQETKKAIERLNADIAAQVRNLREADDALKRFIQDDIKELTDELAKREAALRRMEDTQSENQYLIHELNGMKKRLLSFEEFAKGAQPEALFTLVHSIVDRIYITTDGTKQKCQVYIKGCATEDYSDVLGAAGYIEEEPLLPVASYVPPMCDLDYYSICAEVPTKSILRR